MVTLSVTRSRVAKVLRDAAALLEREGWDPTLNPIADVIDRAAGYTPGRGSRDAEDTTFAAWDALTARTGVEPTDWEREPDRTQADILTVLRAAADGVVR